LLETKLGEHYALPKQYLVDFGHIFDWNYHHNVPISCHISLHNGRDIYFLCQKYFCENSWNFGYNMRFF